MEYFTRSCKMHKFSYVFAKKNFPKHATLTLQTMAFPFYVFAYRETFVCPEMAVI